MGLENYKYARWRFTWKGRSKRCGNRRVIITGPCKNQIGDEGEGKCVIYSISMVLESHIKLKYNIDAVVPTASLETDLKNFGDVEHKGNAVWHACAFLYHTGALALHSEDGVEKRYKLHSYQPIEVNEPKDIKWLLENYMQYGPLLGVFPIRGDDMENYGQTELDELYFVSMHNILRAYHCVALPGFGANQIYPFWHFQNSYGSEWRGPGRGFGQLYAPHLQELYGLLL